MRRFASGINFRLSCPLLAPALTRSDRYLWTASVMLRLPLKRIFEMQIESAGTPSTTNETHVMRDKPQLKKYDVSVLTTASEKCSDTTAKYTRGYAWRKQSWWESTKKGAPCLSRLHFFATGLRVWNSKYVYYLSCTRLSLNLKL